MLFKQVDQIFNWRDIAGTLQESDTNTDAIKGYLRATLGKMRSEFENKEVALPLFRLLSFVIEEIKLTPCVNQRAGEDIDIRLKPSGWPEFYRFSREEWPKLDTCQPTP